MRTLLLMRGAPGAGKSTWIAEHNLSNYTLSPDNIRIMCSSLSMQVDGTYKILQDYKNEEEVWKVLFELLEYRMKRGEFTVIDATCSKTKDINKYKDLAHKYRYKMYIVDFTKIPLETCLKQNMMRPEYKQVPEATLRKIYARFATQGVPSGVRSIQPEQFETEVLETPIDLSSYKHLLFIGDIHGCYDTLQKALFDDQEPKLDPETAYIFLGDYLDRGPHNDAVLKFLDSIKDEPNVCLLCGNHENHLMAFANQEESSALFEHRTKPQLLEGGWNCKKVRQFCLKLRQMSYIKYHDYEILACHGGIPTLPSNLLFVPTRDLIRGVGTYDDCETIANNWYTSTKDKCLLVFGHRNPTILPIQINSKVFDLECSVERNGNLRSLKLSYENGCLITEAKETPAVESERFVPDFTTETTTNEIEGDSSSPLTILRNNRMINEKQLKNNVSSFNFSRAAFLKQNWNQQTILARGLFLNNQTGEVIARSYQKFFNLNERPETRFSSLIKTLKFPVVAYRKENGFLGIVSYRKDLDQLFIASKSTDEGPYAEYARNLLKPYEDSLLKFFRGLEQTEMVSLVFEIIDIENDPHIIKYDHSHVVLLDVIYNNLDYSKYSYEDVVKVAKILNCPVKIKEARFDNIKELKEFLSTLAYDNAPTYLSLYEGYVFEDSIGFMFKGKTAYYLEWKKLRAVATECLNKGYYPDTNRLYNALENYFYGFCKTFYLIHKKDENGQYECKTDIINLRSQFEQEHPELAANLLMK